MPTVKVHRDIQASPEDLFDLAQDYRLRLAWDPFLRQMKFRGGAKEAAVGVEVWVEAKNGLEMSVRYITLKRPERVAMTMVDGPAMFASFSGSWLFRAMGSGVTRVTFLYNYTLRGGVFGRIGEPVVSWILARDMSARLDGLRRGAEEDGLLAKLHDASSDLCPA